MTIGVMQCHGQHGAIPLSNSLREQASAPRKSRGRAIAGLGSSVLVDWIHTE